MSPAADTKHPHITRTDGVCGGEPVVRGTRFTVRAVVNYVLRLGMTAEEVVREWPQLAPAQIYDALSFYYDYQDEMDELHRKNAATLDGRASA